MGVDIAEGAGGLIVRQREARGPGFGPKTQNRAIVARFRACRVKRRWGVVVGGGGCGPKARKWRGGCVSANARGRDLGQNPKLSCRGSVTGVPCERAVGSGMRW